MNRIFTMKLVSLTARLALVGVAASLLGAALDVQALGLLAAALAALFLLVVVGDYAPLRRQAVVNHDNVVTFPSPRELAESHRRAA